MAGTWQSIDQRMSWRLVAGACGLAVGFGGTQLVMPPQGFPSGSTIGQVQQFTGPASQPTASTVYCRNCKAVWAAGVAPIRRGQSGYGGHLDRDGDGVGCE